MSVNEVEIAAPVRTASEHTFAASDGAELFYRAWAPTSGGENAVILLHRGHEHSGRFDELVQRLKLDDCWFFAWDARGHGRSPGERGYAESFSCFVRDLDDFVRHVSQTHEIPQQNMAVVGVSIGAVLAATWVHDFAPPIRALVLATPAFRVKLYVPLAIPGLRLLQKVQGKAFVKSYVKPSMLTHDEEEIKKIAGDELMSRNIAVNVLLDMYDTATRIVDDAGAIHTPTLVLTAGSDWVVHQRPQQRFFERLSSPVKQMEVFPGLYHAVLHEKERERPIAKVREFLTSQFAAPAASDSLLDADQRGYTKQVADKLAQPLPLLSPKRLYYGVMKLTLGTVGRLSKGISLGWRTGFNSGMTLDHIYRNTPEGVTPLGRLADRMYLSSPGWRGIRQRKIHLERLLARALREFLDRGECVHLLDVATGQGRYVLDVIAQLNDERVTALLCDWNEEGLEAGRLAAQERGIAGVKFEQGDAFDEQRLASIEPRPNVAIVSGLYELFGDNQRVLASLRGISKCLHDGGLLLYTNQPWHPQLELIARSLVGLDGKLWVMRCRTQLEMDQLAAAAGFIKQKMLIDDEGIFTVSVARKAAH